MNLLTELNQEGTTIVMVTHSQHDASYAHRVVHLFDGQIDDRVGKPGHPLIKNRTIANREILNETGRI